MSFPQPGRSRAYNSPERISASSYSDSEWISTRRALAVDPRFHGPARLVSGGSGSGSVPVMNPTPTLSLNDHRHNPTLVWDAIIRLVGALRIEIDGEWQIGRRYFSLASMKELLEPDDETKLAALPIPLAPVH